MNREDEMSNNQRREKTIMPETKSFEARTILFAIVEAITRQGCLNSEFQMVNLFHVKNK
jgi:hypothetical protein